MEQETFNKKMGVMRILVKVGIIVSSLLALTMVVLLICFNFAGVTTITTLPGTKYQNGFTYPGWQLIYYGVGEMIIQGYTEYSFNIWNCLALFVPLLTLLILQPIYLSHTKKRGTNTKKAVFEFIMAGVVLVGAIMLFNCDLFAIDNASKVTGSYSNYYTEYLLPALNGEVSYVKEAYPYVILIVGIIVALFKAANGGLLIYQKKFAKKYAK